MGLAFPKTYRADRKAAQRKVERRRRLTRAQVRRIVFNREHGLCQRCKRPVSFDVAPYADDYGEVNEPEGRHTDAHLDPGRCELVCHACHFGGPSHGHAPTKARMRK